MFLEKSELKNSKNELGKNILVLCNNLDFFLSQIQFQTTLTK